MKKTYTFAQLLELDPDDVSWSIEKVESNNTIYKKLIIEKNEKISFYCADAGGIFEWMGTCSFSDDTDGRILDAVMEAMTLELVNSPSYSVITIASNH